jgi:hypothetical protein
MTYRDAAVKATNTFVAYTKELRSQISTSIHASRLMLRALRCAHESIVQGNLSFLVDSYLS